MKKVKNKNCYIDDGDKYWYLENDIQRPYTDDVEVINDQLYIKGKLCHREGGPACEHTNGDKEYYQYGKLHRIGGPAFEYDDGEGEYYQYGKLHRIGGPAIEYPNGDKEYWENGNLHREDGAAVIYNNGIRKIYEYWLCGKKFKTKKDMEHYRDYLMIME